MLTISSIGVAPRLPQAPVVTVPPVTPAKPSNAVNQGVSGVAVPAAPSGDGGTVQVTFVPTSLPPAYPTQDVRRAAFPKTALPAGPQPSRAAGKATKGSDSAAYAGQAGGKPPATPGSLLDIEV